MPVPTHFRVTLRGVFLGSPEAWSFGYHMRRDVGAGGDAGLGDIDESGLADAVTTFFSTAQLCAKVQCDDVRVYQIGTNGKMEGNGPLLHTFEPGELVGHGAANPNMPPQVSVAVTFVAENRGPAKLGRCYLPGPSRTPGADWLLSDAAATEYLEAVTGLLKDTSDAIDLPGTLDSSTAVNISKGPVGSGTGTLQDIDHLEVGHAYDTIRNRRKSLIENRLVGGHIDW